MSQRDRLQLAAGPLAVDLLPALGGSIASFEWAQDGRRASVLRAAEATPLHILDVGSFPLVPFCNRIRDGRFSFRGRSCAIRPNMPPDPSPLHGQGWLAAWDVLACAPASADLRFRHKAGEWPWTFEAQQSFELDPGGLSLSLRCRNESNEAMPCGLGQHPYFPCGPDTRIETSVSKAWTVDQRVLPVEEVPATGRYDLSDRLVCGQDLDNGFSGWSGSARIRDPRWPIEVEMSSPNAAFFQLYSPSDGALFVAEPVTHANAALNQPEEEWEALGVHILEPGEELVLDMRIAVGRAASVDGQKW